MALTPQEQEIVRYGQQQGKSREEISKAVGAYRFESTATQQPDKPGVFSSNGVIGKTARKITDFLGGGAVADTYGAEIAKATATPAERNLIEQPTVRDTVASGLKLGSNFVPGPAAGSSLLRVAAAGAGGGYLYDIGQNLQEGETGGRALAPGAGTVIGAAAAPAIQLGANAIGRGASQIAASGRRAAQEVAERVPSKVASGASQMAQEVAERVPRFISRVSNSVDDAALRAERIRTSPPAVQNAIKSGLDDRVTNTVVAADPETLKGYKEILDIAESSSSTLKPKARPEIVAGRAAGEQYKMIDTQRKTVGAQIGAAVDTLSKTERVPMVDKYAQLDDILRSQGIKITYNDKNKAILSFTGKFTPGERARINELYSLATEGGEAVTPRQIYDMDQLFSKLQRETRMEGLGDLIIEGPDGQQLSMFRAFRDIFTNALDEVGGDSIRNLNRAYRNLVTLQDDIENSIIKTGNFDAVKGADPAEFAQTNLRRLFSDAQSAAAYREIAEEMDTISRSLGYTGARPDDLALFATAMRDIYPDAIPKTGFTGSIKTSLADIAGQVLSAGKADVTDQQKALRALIENALLQKK